MELRDTTAYLLRVPDVANWLRLADNYIQAYNRMPTGFVLPADHSMLRPVIEAFAKDATAWGDYLRALRDATEGLVYDEIHELYRTVSVRALQVVRRTRIRKAVLLLLPQVEELLDRKVSYDEQMVMARMVEQDWGAQRLALLERERNALTSKRIPTEERAAILDAFWANLDKKLDKGTTMLSDETINKIVKDLYK